MAYFKGQSNEFSTVWSAIQAQNVMNARIGASYYLRNLGPSATMRQLKEFLQTMLSAAEAEENRLLGNVIGVESFSALQQRVDAFYNEHQGLINAGDGKEFAKKLEEMQRIFQYQARIEQFYDIINNNVNVRNEFTVEITQGLVDQGNSAIYEVVRAALGERLRKTLDKKYTHFRLYFDKDEGGLRSDIGIVKLFGDLKIEQHGGSWYVYPTFQNGITVSRQLENKIAQMMEAQGAKFHTTTWGAQQAQYIVQQLVTLGLIQPSEQDITIDFLENQGLVFYGNTNSIKGFMGELFWLLFFYNVTKDKEKGKIMLRSTGNVITTKKKQAAIDIMLNGIGFQVKNYSLHEGQIIFGNDLHSSRTTKGVKLNKLMEFRDVNFGTATDAIKRFYTSYAYNQLVTKEIPDVDLWDNNGPLMQKATVDPIIAKAQFGPIFEAYQDLAKNFEQYLDELIAAQGDKLIGIDRADNLGASTIGQLVTDNGGRQYKKNRNFNTCFLIRDKIIPSSYIIRGILALLRKNEQTNGGQDGFITIKVSHESIPPQFKSGLQWPYAPQEPDFYNISKMTTVTYTVSIDFNKLLEKINPSDIKES